MGGSAVEVRRPSRQGQGAPSEAACRHATRSATAAQGRRVRPRPGRLGRRRGLQGAATRPAPPPRRPPPPPARSASGAPPPPASRRRSHSGSTPQQLSITSCGTSTTRASPSRGRPTGPCRKRTLLELSGHKTSSLTRRWRLADRVLSGLTRRGHRRRVGVPPGARGAGQPASGSPCARARSVGSDRVSAYTAPAVTTTRFMLRLAVVPSPRARLKVPSVPMTGPEALQESRWESGLWVTLGDSPGRRAD